MRLTAQQVYDKLISEDQILTLQGQIKFHLGDVSIIVKQRDVVGNIMQEWLQGWLDKRGVEYAPDENSQMPPDFFLNPEDKTKNLLEVKAFNRSGSPGFDIADFRMYAEEILEKPYMLDVDYLIFGYDMSENGIVTIKDVWLKKVWEITRRMEDYPINLQIKDGVIHKIRPGVWYSDRAVDYTIFESLEDFISAVEETTFKEPKLRDTLASKWLSTFQRSYKEQYGRELDIPRWNAIKDKYDMKSVRRKEKALEAMNRAEARQLKLIDRLTSAQTSLEKIKLDGKREKIEKAQDAVLKAQAELAAAEDKLQKAVETYNSM